MAIITADDEQDALDAPGNTSSRTTADDAQDVLSAQDTHGTEDPMQAVLDTAELREMILLNVSTKDLARSLSVSKYWRGSILSSTTLRRKLFLDPDPGREYLSIKFSFFEETATRMPIHEPHPILQPYSINAKPYSINAKSCLGVNKVPRKSLQNVHPATLLFQPPLDSIEIACLGCGAVETVGRFSGVTFGQLVEVLDHDECIKDMCRLFRSGALASNAEVVMDAREARAEVEASSGLE